MLCTTQQARDAGCTGTDPEVAGWIAAATVRITRYTSQFFEPTTVAVVADVAPGGLVLLPRRVRTVTSVTLHPDGPVLPSSAYAVTSAADAVGALDSVRLAYGGWDDLVAGAESYSGGWANLFDCYEQALVAGEFGLDAPPSEVSTGCALLAADMQAKATPSDADAAVDESLDVDDEGNNVRITDDEPAAGDVSPVSSTGNAAVDALLAPYINGAARPALWGV